MEYEIEQLEKILGEILNIPKRQKNERTAGPVIVSSTKFEPPISTDNKILIEENLACKKRIGELSAAIFELQKELEKQNKEISSLSSTNSALIADAKSLREAVLQAKGAIRVLCRIKPTRSNCQMKFDDRGIFLYDKRYVLDHIFEPESNQSDVFSELKPEVECVMEGYRVCIFAYGQTGSGKTYTMSGSETEDGLIFRALNMIDAATGKLRDGGFNVKFEMKYIEVYNENIRDLVSDKDVTIFHDSNGIKLKGCEIVTGEEIKPILDVMRISGMKRKTGETKCNSVSSRSHSVFVLEMHIRSETEQRCGTLCLIDLAGSERLKESKAEDDRLRETQFINKSLSALGNVIVGLKRKDGHVPFRDSKLTHLMQEYLTGKARTTMIVNIDPECTDESVCSLRFATKVSECSLGSATKTMSKFI